MDTRYLFNARRHARGAAKPITVAIIAVLALLGLGAWLLIIRPHQELMQADAGNQPVLPVAATSKAAPPPPADVASMDVDQLLGEARKAINQQRYLAPAGNNAFEFYLRVLQKQPGNKVATDALRETFPFAADSAEQAVNARNFDDAQRQIDLLAKADPTNFTLTILRSKLDAQKKTLDKQQQLAQDQQKAQEQAAQKAIADKAAAVQLAEQQKAEQLAEQQKAKQTEQARAKQAAATAEAKPAAANAAPSQAQSSAGQTSQAVLVKATAPVYPRPALLSRQSGWVIVSFTVEPNGRTANVQVVDAQPKRIFDRAATDAVLRYRFTPAMQDGVAVSSVLQRKIEFKL